MNSSLSPSSRVCKDRYRKKNSNSNNDVLNPILTLSALFFDLSQFKTSLISHFIVR
ncbi:unnamed protein product [Arabidopsis lyrata]|uniref:Uncharacterized protein n=1 Tax=Arabidopsis lyrata subsp. lyrata TaxID=81972 RepID=D7KZ03_ARALL|nr:hypothetical protein ARALYDRAFT_893796 [Arabidopsis lyrata subsp. lyrata]CAH8256853.1 unnamed protein product [Arabidopsis lyrata]